MQENLELLFDGMEKLLSVAADRTRLKILYAIGREEKCVSEIMEETGASQSLVSHQLRVLKDADFLKNRKEGTRVYYRFADEHIFQLLEAVAEHASEKIGGDFHA